MMLTRNLTLCASILALFISPALATTIDFETDDSGNSLVNGQAIYSTARADREGIPFSTDTVLEFGNLFDLSDILDTPLNSHFGPAIFDSNPAGPNAGGPDGDLLVNQGNILILQSDNPDSGSGDTGDTTLDGTNGLLFDNPNDEADLFDSGSIVFDFSAPFEMLSIDVIDFNGGFFGEITLTDTSNNTRVYTIFEEYTTDGGAATFDLTATGLLPQGPGGGVAPTVVDSAGFDSLSVDRLQVHFIGASGGTSSGGIDNLVFNIPEPTTVGLLFIGAFGALPVLRRRAAKNA